VVLPVGVLGTSEKAPIPCVVCLMYTSRDRTQSQARPTTSQGGRKGEIEARTVAIGNLRSD